MSSDARLDPKVFVESEHKRELFHDRGPDSCATSSDDVHMLIADGDNSSASVQQPEIRTRNDIQLAIKNPSYPTPADSGVAGCPSALCEKCNESHGTRSPTLKSLESNPERIVAAAAGLNRLSNKIAADEPFVKVLVDAPSDTIDSAQHTLEIKRTIGPDSAVESMGTNAASSLQSFALDHSNGIAARTQPQRFTVSNCAALDWSPELVDDPSCNYTRLDDDFFTYLIPNTMDDGRPYFVGLDEKSSLKDKCPTVTETVWRISPTVRERRLSCRAQKY